MPYTSIFFLYRIGTMMPFLLYSSQMFTWSAQYFTNWSELYKVSSINGVDIFMRGSKETLERTRWVCTIFLGIVDPLWPGMSSVLCTADMVLLMGAFTQEDCLFQGEGLSVKYECKENFLTRRIKCAEVD